MTASEKSLKKTGRKVICFGRNNLTSVLKNDNLYYKYIIGIIRKLWVD